MQANDFSYHQYNDLNWPHQAESDMNGFINDFIIDEIVSVQGGASLSVFDIGFGIGAFIRRLVLKTSPKRSLFIEGCEPSEKNYRHFMSAPVELRPGVTLKTHRATFLDSVTDRHFDLITAIYVFPHIPYEELDKTAERIHALLDTGGRFVMVVVNDEYLKDQLQSGTGAYTLLQKEVIEYGGKTYTDYLHYTQLPGIGRILDHNRDSEFYRHLFEDKGLRLSLKKDLEDSGYTCTVHVFRKV